MVKYVYDAWGKHKAYAINGAEIPAQAVTHIAHINPFRYRGYFYDRETGLYYLKSRYYDPETGRFINMDGVRYADTSFLNGLNLYAYCNNNPVMNVDPNGTSWWSQAGKFLADIGNSIADFVVDEVYGNAIKPACEWVAETALPTAETLIKNGVNEVGKFFTETLEYNWLTGASSVFQITRDAFELIDFDHSIFRISYRWKNGAVSYLGLGNLNLYIGWNPLKRKYGIVLAGSAVEFSTGYLTTEASVEALAFEAFIGVMDGKSKVNLPKFYWGDLDVSVDLSYLFGWR